ncbi:hypothetical protein TNCV_3571021 [Trichonephila clavipes]|nr:hypothetical protein TNCV_3571021 [Trichonephila clavipes]
MAEEAKPYNSLCEIMVIMPFDEERREYLSKKVQLDQFSYMGTAHETFGLDYSIVFRAIRATLSRKIFLPLMTRNRVPNIIPWNEVAEQAFTKLKAQLVKAPSLYTPDLSKPYQLLQSALVCLKTMKKNPIAKLKLG